MLETRVYLEGDAVVRGAYERHELVFSHVPLNLVVQGVILRFEVGLDVLAAQERYDLHQPKRV